MYGSCMLVRVLTTTWLPLLSCGAAQVNKNRIPLTDNAVIEEVSRRCSLHALS